MREVADALFDDVIGYSRDFAFVGLIGVGDDLGYAEGVGVERGLWDEAVREGDAEDAGDEGC